MALQQITHDPARDQSMQFTDGGVAQHASYTWYRGPDCNFGPTRTHLNQWQGYHDYFLRGLLPDSQLIGPDSRITAFGSCFAANISAWLAKRKYNVLNRSETSAAYIVRSGEGFVNSYSILQQFQWAFEGIKPSVELWHGYDAKAFGYDEEVRRETSAIFSATDVFILTFGLSEVWYDKITKEVFWRAVPNDKFDPERHGFRSVSVDENYANVSATIALIRKHRPGAKVILTLSPIPLVATFRNVPCVTANAVSKASLRCAIDRVLMENAGSTDLFYWPSYEIVTAGFADQWGLDLRHVKKPILSFIMRLFERHWCHGGIPDQQLAVALAGAKAADGTLRRKTFKNLRKAANRGEADAKLAKIAARGTYDVGTLQTLNDAFGRAQPTSA